MDERINFILDDMEECLTNRQMDQLQKVLLQRLSEKQESSYRYANEDYVEMFIEAKRIEGCSERTLAYYQTTVEKFFGKVTEHVRKICTEDIREYLIAYQKVNDCSRVTVDNIRRNLSSFFSWLEEEDYIIKSPIRRIHKIRTGSTVKETFTDENIETMRDACTNMRDLAMIDFLYSTGVRVGELVNLDVQDINFEERECVVYGKGSKERKVYFDAKTKIHLQKYLELRTDHNPALFVTLYAPYDRLAISGVEIRLRELGRKVSIPKVHPHKFRRSMATKAIDKGMPIEQVQRMLGHQQIDTTMHYAMVNQNNVKISHRRYMT